MDEKAQLLLKSCRELLQKINDLTISVSKALIEEEIESVESIFLQRGEVIRKLSNDEQEIEKLLSVDKSILEDNGLKEHVETRNSLFKEIRSQNKELEGKIKTKRESILKELKHIEKGKKMHKGYINNTSFPSGFVDIKE